MVKWLFSWKSHFDCPSRLSKRMGKKEPHKVYDGWGRQSQEEFTTWYF